MEAITRIIKATYTPVSEVQSDIKFLYYLINDHKDITWGWPVNLLHANTRSKVTSNVITSVCENNPTASNDEILKIIQILKMMED